MSPRDPEILFTAAQVYNEAGDQERAVMFIQHVLAAGYSPAQIRDAPALDNQKQCRISKGNFGWNKSEPLVALLATAKPKEMPFDETAHTGSCGFNLDHMLRFAVFVLLLAHDLRALRSHRSTTNIS